jgi:hypothetical protein
VPATAPLAATQGRCHSIGTVVSGTVIGADFLAGALYTSTVFFVLIDSFAASAAAVEFLISRGASVTRTGGCVAHPAVAMTMTNNSITERPSLMRTIPTPFE